MILAALSFESRYSDIVDFVRKADRIVTYVTNDERSWLERDYLRGKSIAVFNKSHKGEFVQSVLPKKRDGLIIFLKAVAGPKSDVFPGCFMPHHFVFAARGKRHIEIEICFTCARLICSGNLNYNAEVSLEALAKTESVFGMKFNPSDPLPSMAPKSENTVEILKGKGQKL